MKITLQSATDHMSVVCEWVDKHLFYTTTFLLLCEARKAAISLMLVAIVLQLVHLMLLLLVLRQQRVSVRRKKSA